MEANYAPLWYWVRERESIRGRKDSGATFPWTADPVLSRYRFCNVRREDDRGTIWIRKNIREPFTDNPNLWFMLCIARYINWPATLQELITSSAWPVGDTFDSTSMIRVLLDRKARGEKVFTGAYMISAPATAGFDKASYVVENVLGALWDDDRIFNSNYPTMQEAHSVLANYKGWGMFMAYQAIVDMRYTRLLSAASDISTWAAAGPGTLRGLNRVHGRSVKTALSQAQALVEMRDIYARIGDATGIAVDFSDIPNILCETDKYLRVANGEGKPRALYVEGRGS